MLGLPNAQIVESSDEIEKTGFRPFCHALIDGRQSHIKTFAVGCFYLDKIAGFNKETDEPLTIKRDVIDFNDGYRIEFFDYLHDAMECYSERVHSAVEYFNRH